MRRRQRPTVLLSRHPVDSRIGEELIQKEYCAELSSWRRVDSAGKSLKIIVSVGILEKNWKIAVLWKFLEKNEDQNAKTPEKQEKTKKFSIFIEKKLMKIMDFHFLENSEDF